MINDSEGYVDVPTREEIDLNLQMVESESEVQHHVNMYNQLITRIDDIPFFCSLPQHDTATALKMHNYKNTFQSAMPYLKNGQGIMMTNLMVYRTQYKDEDENVVDGPTMIVIDHNGTGYRIGSKLLVKQILEFVRDWQPLPYEEPVRIRASDEILPNGNRTYRLIVGD